MVTKCGELIVTKFRNGKLINYWFVIGYFEYSQEIIHY